MKLFIIITLVASFFVGLGYMYARETNPVCLSEIIVKDAVEHCDGKLTIATSTPKVEDDDSIKMTPQDIQLLEAKVAEDYIADLNLCGKQNMRAGLLLQGAENKINEWKDKAETCKFERDNLVNIYQCKLL